MENGKELIESASKMKIENSIKKNFLDSIKTITKKNIEKDYDSAIRDACINYPCEILFNNADYKDVKKNNIDSLVEGIISRLPQKTGFIGKQIEKMRRNVLSDEDLEKVRTYLMEFVNYAQSKRIDDLCMRVMENPLKMPEDKLQNWLELMIKNCSGNLLQNFSLIIDNIKKDSNLPKEIREKTKETERNRLLKKAGCEKKWPEFLKQVGENFTQTKKTVDDKIWDELFGNKKAQGRHINCVVRKFPDLYEQISDISSPIELKTTIGSVMTIFNDLNEYEKWIPALEEAKENIMFVIAKVIGNSKVDLDTYSKFTEILIEGLREESSINKVLDNLFKFHDKYTVVEKSKKILTKQPEDKYSYTLKRSVIYKLIDLEKSNEIDDKIRDNIKSCITKFISENSVIDNNIEKEILINDIFEKICETSFPSTIEYVKSYLNISSKESFKPKPKIVDLVVQTDDFNENEKAIVIDKILNNYDNYNDSEKSSIYTVLLKLASGKIKSSDYIREKIVELMCKNEKERKFLKDLKSKLDEENLWGNVTNNIRRKILAEGRITSSEKSEMLRYSLSSVGTMNENTKESLKNDLLDYIINSPPSDKAEIRTFLSDIISKYVLKM